jgi:putative salt-induced outer membrane protein YdiY
MTFRFPSPDLAALCAAICLVSVSDLQAQSVTFQLRNGDRLSGTIEADHTNQITLKTSWGTVNVPAQEIVMGRFSPTARATNGSAAVLSPLASASPPLTQSKSHKFAGEIQAGVDVLFSEKQRELYSARAKITHAYSHLRNLFDYQFAYGRTDGDVSDNRMLASIKTDFDLTRRFYLYNAGGAGYDAVRKVDFEWEVGPGVGYQWVKRTNFVFRTEVGGNYKAQYLEEDQVTEAFYGRLAEDAMWRVTPRLTVDEKFEYFPSLADLREYRFRVESNLKYALVNNLSFIVTVIDAYETETAQGVPQNDLQIRSSIGVKF